MKHIILFGNCQAQVLAKCLEDGLSEDYSIIFLSNNLRTGGMKPEEEILSLISQCDYLIYQPLGQIYGDLSATNIRNIPRKEATSVSFPYIFNSGMYSLGHAPFAQGRTYGVIYGEEIIRDLLKKYDLRLILKLYKQEEIDFNLGERFSYCMKELQNRETNADIKLTDFIMRNYKQTKLFLTHNHPTTKLFIEVGRQIKDLTDLPISFDSLEIARENYMGFEDPRTPISPYDIKFHGYQFSYHDDWFEKGKSLIELISNSYFAQDT